MANIQVFLTPGLAIADRINGTTCVVVDILRATSCWVTAIANGALSIHPVTTLEECRKLGEEGYMTAAERGGEKITGFELGNSPFEYDRNKVSGEKIAVTTTNGSRAVQKAKDADKVYIGAFLNLEALITVLKKEDDICIICSGWEGGPGIEDILFAGELVNRLSETHTFKDDASLIALEIFNNTGNNVAHFLSKAAHVKRLLRQGLKPDIDYCLKRDIYDVVPVLYKDKIILKTSL